MPINIPTHNINSSYSINIEKISHENSYDFNTIHKHNYFEILFFEKGGGYQLIDFDKVPIKDNSCYIVKPKQIHLLKRSSEADGLLIQFTQETLSTDSFSFLKSFTKSEVVFEQDSILSHSFFSQLHNILSIQKSKSFFYKEKTVHLLSSLLYTLEEQNIKLKNKKLHALTIDFIYLVEEHISRLSVAEYAEKLHISTKKLTQIIKSELNSTPLKYIHAILILNIKRDLAFKQLTHKEIAYNYNFDSPSNFSIFVKKHTGLTPTQLQKQLIQQ
ncbi:AraC family transcriptional regulator [uncultured Tenacibaculum sp.]|uniref:helix-turn-helix domain-containing protein n=1 Tax=uncultured Tenacibaculum sp. TaxID=174713 RepID=UPI0026389C09|nr:AraC family transcriptional regulator [uncultured Tenacibaculum sp.]